MHESFEKYDFFSCDQNRLFRLGVNIHEGHDERLHDDPPLRENDIGNFLSIFSF